MTDAGAAAAPGPRTEPRLDTSGRGRAAIGRWIIAVTVGEAVGFAIAAAVAVGTVGLAMPDQWRYPVIVVGGALEGAVLGGAQLIGMGPRRPGAVRWIVATALGAALAWSIGLLPGTFAIPLSSPLAVVAPAVGGVVLLATIPVAQWLTIRPRAHAVRWIPVNMGAWAIAILWTFAPSPIVDESTSIGVLITVYAVAGLLMAGTVATLTATTARRLFA